MARRPNKQEFYNTISLAMWLSYGISSLQENKQFDTNAKDDPYETLVVANNKEMDQLVVGT
jgi:hypothetical protein